MKDYEKMFNEVKCMLDKKIVDYSSSSVTHMSLEIMGRTSLYFKKLEIEYGRDNQWETAWNEMINKIRILKHNSKVLEKKYSKYYFNPFLRRVFKTKANLYSTGSTITTMLFVAIEPILDEYTGSDRFANR